MSCPRSLLLSLRLLPLCRSIFLFFIAAPPPEFHPLSLHDALPISSSAASSASSAPPAQPTKATPPPAPPSSPKPRSEEHTSELQSRGHLVCRLLLEKKNR